MVGEDYPHGLDDRVVRGPETTVEGRRMTCDDCGVCTRCHLLYDEDCLKEEEE